MVNRKRARSPSPVAGPSLPTQRLPRILWRCEWRLLEDGSLVWETIDMQGRVRQQKVETLSRFWPLDDVEVEQMKRQIRMQLERIDV